MSPQRKRVVLLCHRIPYPPDKGDKIRAYHLLRHLARTYDVWLGAFVDDPAEMAHADVMRGLCAEICLVPLNPAGARLRSLRALTGGRPLTYDYYRDARMTDFVARALAARPAAGIAYSAAVAPYLRGAGPVPVLVDLVDADSAKWAAYARTGNPLQRLVYGREGRVLAAAEATLSQWARRVFLVSPEEAELVARHPLAAPARVDWYANGIDTDYWSRDALASALDPSSYDVVFTGAMDYRPNIEGAQFLVHDILPLLRARRPGLRVGIVGARPTPAVRALSQVEGVGVTGRVPDVRPYLAGARVAVAPLAIARGVQNKVLEALAMATPLVCSPAALVGTGAIAGVHAKVADTAVAFATAIGEVLDHPDAAAAMAAAGCAHVRTARGWTAMLARFETALSEQ